MDAAKILPQVLIVLGVGFLIANVRLLVQFVSWFRRRRSALVTWPGPPPPFYGLVLFLGVALGVLVLVKLFVLQRPVLHTFGEGMMFVYFGYLVPLSRRIGRGFYEDGIWAETGFMPYWQIGGIAWREGEPKVLLLMSRLKQLARPLIVPAAYYAAARRLLRDKIAAHDINYSGVGLELEGHDEREDI